MKRRTFFKESSLTGISSLFVLNLTNPAPVQGNAVELEAIRRLVETAIHAIFDDPVAYTECRAGLGVGGMCYDGEFLCVINGVSATCGNGCVDNSSSPYTCYP
jgi:hypothetical protein